MNSETEDTFFFDRHPSPTAIIESEIINYCNPAFKDLLAVKNNEILKKENWYKHFFMQDAGTSFLTFLNNDETEIHLDIVTAVNVQKYIRINKLSFQKLANQKKNSGKFKSNNKKQSSFILVFTDLTEIKDENQTVKLAFDEFLNISLELEHALETITEQKELLSQQNHTTKIQMLAIEKQKKIMENELEIARALQQSIFSENFNQYDFVDVEGVYIPMEALSGDMWDFFEFEKGFLAVLGDVMGHGVASSLISLAAKALFHNKSEELSRTRVQGLTDTMMRSINPDIIALTERRYYLTAAVVYINELRQMEYLTAGHPAILLVPNELNKKHLELQTEFPMLGMFHEPGYKSRTVQLAKGDFVLLYSDCLTESHDTSFKQLSLEFIAKIISDNKDKALKTILDEILRMRRAYFGTDFLPDDLTLILIKIK